VKVWKNYRTSQNFHDSIFAEYGSFFRTLARPADTPFGKKIESVEAKHFSYVFVNWSAIAKSLRKGFLINFNLISGFSRFFASLSFL
jgi:hypothetical protein